jgi:hypothetical protein
MVHTYIPATLEAEVGGLQVWGEPGKVNETLSQKQKYKHRIVAWLKVVECLPRMHVSVQSSVLHTHTNVLIHYYSNVYKLQLVISTLLRISL